MRPGRRGMPRSLCCAVLPAADQNPLAAALLGSQSPTSLHRSTGLGASLRSHCKRRPLWPRPAAPQGGRPAAPRRLPAAPGCRTRTHGALRQLQGGDCRRPPPPLLAAAAAAVRWPPWTPLQVGAGAPGMVQRCNTWLINVVHHRLHPLPRRLSTASAASVALQRPPLPPPASPRRAHGVQGQLV